MVWVYSCMMEGGCRPWRRGFTNGTGVCVDSEWGGKEGRLPKGCVTHEPRPDLVSRMLWSKAHLFTVSIQADTMVFNILWALEGDL